MDYHFMHRVSAGQNSSLSYLNGSCWKNEQSQLCHSQNNSEDTEYTLGAKKKKERKGKQIKTKQRVTSRPGHWISYRWDKKCMMKLMSYCQLFRFHF